MPRRVAKKVWVSTNLVKKNNNHTSAKSNGQKTQKKIDLAKMRKKTQISESKVQMTKSRAGKNAKGQKYEKGSKS